LTQADIAERLNAGRDFTLSQQTISNDIRAIQKEWLASSLRDFDEMRAQELAKIDRLEREYWRGWERSCEDAETVRKEGPASGVEKIVKTEKGQAGDPRFLAGVMSCIDRRCKLVGMDAPKELKVYDWRKEIREHGLDPDAAIDSLVEQFIQPMQASDDRDGARES
jgi:hypothetical protein